MEISKKKSIFLKIKNKYLTLLIVSFLKKYRLLNIIKYNKYIQNQTNIDYNDYKKFKEVEIEILLTGYIIYNSDKKCFIFNIFILFYNI